MSQRPIPDLHIEQARLGQRRIDDVAAVDALAADDAAFLAAMPPGNAAATIRAVAAERSASAASSSFVGRWRRAVAVVVPGVAMAAIVFAVLTPRPVGDDGVVGSDDVRPKGGAPQLLVQRVGAAGAELVQDGDLAAAGDVLQLGWVASKTATAVRGVVVSVDGRGTVTRHLPLEATEPAATIGASSLLPSSYELDDAPRFERFFLVTGSDVDVAAVVVAAERLARSASAGSAPLQLPARWNVSVVTVRK